jgi:hypothetical protein
MAPVMSRYASRERAAEAFQLRASRYSWREVAERLGYRSIGVAQTAVNRHVERLRREPTSTAVEAHKFAIETRTRALSQRFAAAFRNGDDDTLVTLNREIVRNEAELAKLGGLYEPETLNVNVSQTPAAIIAEARERLLAVVDAEVVEPQGDRTMTSLTKRSRLRRQRATHPCSRSRSVATVRHSVTPIPSGRLTPWAGVW